MYGRNLLEFIIGEEKSLFISFSFLGDQVPGVDGVVPPGGVAEVHECGGGCRSGCQDDSTGNYRGWSGGLQVIIMVSEVRRMEAGQTQHGKKSHTDDPKHKTYQLVGHTNNYWC